MNRRDLLKHSLAAPLAAAGLLAASRPASADRRLHGTVADIVVAPEATFISFNNGTAVAVLLNTDSGQRAFIIGPRTRLHLNGRKRDMRFLLNQLYAFPLETRQQFANASVFARFSAAGPVAKRVNITTTVSGD